MKIAPQSDLSFNTLQHPEEVKVESFVPSTGKMMKLGLSGQLFDSGRIAGGTESWHTCERFDRKRCINR